MRIAHIAITNMTGFGAGQNGEPGFAAPLAAVVLIQGANEAGKTSFLDCIKYAFGRGHDEDIIHAGAEAGEILITFDDGSVVKARASRETHQTTRSYRAPGAKRFVVTREQIDAMANAIGYDPLRFKDLDEKEQIASLSKITKFTATPEQIRKALGGAEAEITGASIPETDNALDIIAAYDKALRARRPELSGAAESQEAHAAELEKTLPPEAPDQDWEAEAARIRSEKGVLEKAQAELIGRVQQELAKREGDAKAEAADRRAAIDQDINARIRDLEAQRARRKEEVAEQEQEALGDLRKRAAAKHDEIQGSNAPRRDELNQALGTAEAHARAQQQATGTRAAIQKARAEAGQKRARWDALTAAIERLAGLRLDLLKQFPIPGVVIEDGRLWAENSQGALVPFRRWNEERQIRFCLQLAVLAHGKAGFICVDRAESLDSKHRQGLISAAKKYADAEGLQFLIASVSDYQGLLIEPVEL